MVSCFHLKFITTVNIHGLHAADEEHLHCKCPARCFWYAQVDVMLDLVSHLQVELVTYRNMLLMSAQLAPGLIRECTDPARCPSVVLQAQPNARRAASPKALQALAAQPSCRQVPTACFVPQCIGELLEPRALFCVTHSRCVLHFS